MVNKNIIDLGWHCMTFSAC